MPWLGTVSSTRSGRPEFTVNTEWLLSSPSVDLGLKRILGEICLTLAAKFTLRLPCLLASQQARQSEQVLDPEASPSSRHGDERVDPLDVGPARRNRMDTFVSWLPEEHPVLAPSVGVAEQLEVLAGQRVEGMGDDEPPRTLSTICS
jgi:hypothetical protein